MTDWKTLPAGRELDRVIAEHLGWRVKPAYGDILDGFELATDKRANGAGLFNPDGEPIAGAFVDYQDAYNILSHDVATQKAWWWAGQENLYPLYSTDANAALALLSDLPPELKFKLEIWRVDDIDFKDKFWRDLRGKLFYLAMFFTGESEDEERIAQEEADAPALAICRAWLDWKERQK